MPIAYGQQYMFSPSGGLPPPYISPVMIVTESVGEAFATGAILTDTVGGQQVTADAAALASTAGLAPVTAGSTLPKFNTGSKVQVIGTTTAAVVISQVTVSGANAYILLLLDPTGEFVVDKRNMVAFETNLTAYVA